MRGISYTYGLVQLQGNKQIVLALRTLSFCKHVDQPSAKLEPLKKKFYRWPIQSDQNPKLTNYMHEMWNFCLLRGLRNIEHCKGLKKIKLERSIDDL